MKSALQACLIVLASGVMAVLVWAVHPSPPRFDGDAIAVDLEEVSSWVEVQWIDARTREEFEEERVPGAILLNVEEWETQLGELLAGWDPSRPIVVYCSSLSCLRSHEVADRLRSDLGVENVYVLRDGWEAWQEGQAQ